MTELELEYTFLAKDLPQEIRDKKVKPTRIMDVYVPDTPEHSHLRLRQRGEKYEITKKLPVKSGDASAQTENTISLTKDEFKSLSVASQKRVVKDRYNIKIEGYPAEVDVFREKLQGLVMIDFEFGSEKERQEFVRPKIVLADVTQEDFVAGGMLAGKSYKGIEQKLEEFGYAPIDRGLAI